MNFFGKKQTPAEQMRDQNRELRKAQREVDKSRSDMEKQEKQLEMEIKKAAKLGNKQLCTVYAKQLVQLRKQKTRTLTASSQIGAIGSQAKVMQASSRMADAMATTTKTMGKINEQMKPQQIMKTMQDFERENQKMELKEEMIDDTLSSVLDASDDEEEQDAVVAKVLDEIGIEISGKLSEAPGPAKSDFEQGKSKISDSQLEAQLAKLKM